MKTFFAVLWLFGLCFPLPGQVLLKEDFSKKGRFTEDNMTYYNNGVYHVYSYEDVRIFDSSKNFKDFTAEIRTEFISGDTAAFYGLYFRHDTHANGYSFIISAKGYYNLQRSYLRPDGTVGNVEVKTIASGMLDSNFNKRGVNYLRVECSGNIIRLFINGYKIDSVTDDTIPEGVIGFRAGKEVHVHLDDLTLYRKNIPGKYSFKPAIPDSAFDEKGDSETIDLINFNKTEWKDIPVAFRENGLYRIDSSAYINNLIYLNNTDKGFSIRANLKIREWPRHGALRINWHTVNSDDGTEIGIIGDSTLIYAEKPAGIRNIIRNFPFPYETGTLIRLQVDKNDGDIKISVNGRERVLIIDESYETSYFNWIDFRTEAIGIDLYSVKVSKLFTGEFGLITKDQTCPVIRVSGAGDARRKPALGDEPDKIPEEDSTFSNQFLIIMLIGVTQILLIWGIVKWRKAVRYNSTHFVDYIRERNGSFCLNEFSSKFRISRSRATALTNKMVNDYGGYRYPVKDENDAYFDFPTFMSDAPKAPVDSRVYPDVIEKMIPAYAKRVNLPDVIAGYYFVRICGLAAVLQGRLSIRTLQKKIDEGGFELDRSHFSPYAKTEDIVFLLMSQIIDDDRYITLLSDDAPTVLKFHEDLMKHFQNQ